MTDSNIPEAIALDPRFIAGSMERQKLWEQIGLPISPPYMTEEVMNRDYRGRFSCVSERVLEEAQRAMRFVACPKCVKTKSHGEIAVTRLHIGVQYDPMTTFKALARCFCYNCAYEEYWPLMSDPRPQGAGPNAAELWKQRLYNDAMRKMEHQQNMAKMSSPMIRGEDKTGM